MFKDLLRDLYRPSGEDDFVIVMERRKSPRITVVWPVSILAEKGPIVGETRNITLAGMFVQCKETLPGDRIYEVIVGVPDEKPVVVKGRVIWSDLVDANAEGTVGRMVFSFLKMSSEDRRILQELISAHLPLRE